jgi:hypothetical protein
VLRTPDTDDCYDKLRNDEKAEETGCHRKAFEASSSVEIIGHDHEPQNKNKGIKFVRSVKMQKFSINANPPRENQRERDASKYAVAPDGFAPFFAST